MGNKLPVWKITKASYGTILHSFGTFLAKTWAWWLLAFLINESIGFVLGVTRSVNAQHILLPFIPTLVLYGLAVMWHRSILLGEDPRGFRAIRFPFRFWKFLGVAALFTFCVFSPLYLLAEVAVVPRGGLAFKLIFILSALGLSGAFFYVGLRLSLTYPLIATDETNVFDKSWELLKGNLWRVLGIGGLIYLPVAVLIQILESLSARTESLTMSLGSFMMILIFDVLTNFIFVLATCAWAAAGSLSLMHLRGTQPART